jgi:hypothetical protein
MDHRIDVRKRSDPSFRRRDVAGVRRCAKFSEFSGGGAGTCQAVDFMSAAHQLANDGATDRASSAENENAHDASSVI